MTIFTLSSWTTFLGCVPLGEDSHIAPPCTNKGEALFGISSLSHYLDDDHHDTPSSMGYIRDAILHGIHRISLSLHAHGKYLTSHRDTKHIDHVLVHKDILTIVPHDTSLALCDDQLALSLDQHIIFFF